MLLEFTKETAIELLRMQETVEFPVDFDDAWHWLGTAVKIPQKKLYLIAGLLKELISGITRNLTTTVFPGFLLKKRQQEVGGKTSALRLTASRCGG